MSRWAAVLAGGSGTGFWPLSTSDTPKQMLPLAGREPLLVQTVKRLHGLIAPERVLVITGARLAERTRQLLPELPSGNVLIEPRSASTGPALAWATVVAAGRDPSASVLAMHADWFVGDDDAFRASAAAALDVAERHDVLVTVGVVPTRVEVGYGYIIPGDPMTGVARRGGRVALRAQPPSGGGVGQVPLGRRRDLGRAGPGAATGCGRQRRGGCGDGARGQGLRALER